MRTLENVDNSKQDTASLSQNWTKMLGGLVSTLCLLSMVAQAARAGLARNLVNIWTKPVEADESSRPEQRLLRLLTRFDALRTMVMEVVQFPEVESCLIT